MAAPAKPVGKNVEGLNGRFMQVIERLGYTGYSISKVLNTSEPVISSIRNGKHPPNIKLVQLLFEKHAEVNPDWLLTGKGQMFRGPRTNQAATEAIESEGQAVLARLKAIESLLKRHLQAQLERDTLVDETLSGLEKQVGALHRKAGPLTKEPRSAR